MEQATPDIHFNRVTDMTEISLGFPFPYATTVPEKCFICEHKTYTLC
jgi:hypothetical protein